MIVLDSYLRVRAIRTYTLPTKEASAPSVLFFLFAISKQWTSDYPTDSRHFWSSIGFKKLK